MYGTLLLATATLSVCIFWLFYPYKTVVKSPSPMPIVKGYETVRQGEVLVYEYDYVKYTTVVPTVHRQFVDGLIFDSTDITTHLEPGVGHVHVAVPIPYTLPPGKYHLRVFTDFRMNPLRVISAADNTRDFIVLPAPGHPDSAEDTSHTL